MFVVSRDVLFIVISLCCLLLSFGVVCRCCWLVLVVWFVVRCWFALVWVLLCVCVVD